MKNATFITAIVLSAVAVTGTSVLAAGKGGREPVSFQELDADGDGQVTQQEMEAHRTARFTQADTDGDGQLSLDEMQAAAQKKASDRVAKMFEKNDANKDGFLSQDELPKPRRADKMFDRMDADNSGGISEQEFADAKDKMGRHHKKKHQNSDADDS
ncbi:MULTISPECIES: EF-hand domain-containing protein [unclassified Ruegeria]|uniref:EF-hand domain-containing protein n=1 Tax=unclassified Ruegeria TaxID=2625375 RepID=UPI001488FFD8|nr:MULTISPECIES: EF-hand domain-containing protein [unclassified Ruegeria]NOD48430.1 calcium-binding protein [Ruegeria sp. HKCCD5849]NOD52450.1 calcium-binding protein [Ruegeria sp. HKCCD5851]NOD68553.1 calcium-binding protein [Ruegeria sp. HKCCD7303]NOE34640.1 calcium-binding protein [Ruegeria sp. HKCCD7318]